MGKADVINSGVQENKRFVAFSEEQVEAALDLFIAQTIDDERSSMDSAPSTTRKSTLSLLRLYCSTPVVENTPLEVFESGTVVKDQGLPDPTRQLAKNHRTGIACNSCQLQRWDLHLRRDALSENKRMRTSVQARAFVAVCTTGAEELSCRGGKLDNIRRKEGAENGPEE
jgi:hypothetical protein